MSILSCGCQGHPRPALEHNTSCPIRLGFWGAPSEWGVGKYNEKRVYQGSVFVYTSMSWRKTGQNIEEYIREQRKEKLLKIEENGKENI